MANSTYYKKNVHITEKKIGIRKSTIQSLKKKLQSQYAYLHITKKVYKSIIDFLFRFFDDFSIDVSNIAAIDLHRTRID